MTLCGVEEHVQEFGEHRTSRRRQSVVLLADCQDDWSAEEEDGWKEESEVEADVFLRVYHGNLADQRANIDAEVEVEEDSRVRDSWIDYDSLTSLR